jgi:signal transduction histidine kinase
VTHAQAPAVESRELPHARSRRDWIVDTCMFLFAMAFGLVLAADRLDDRTMPGWLLVVDLATCVASCAVLWLRRRWPIWIALAFVPLATYSELSGGAQIVMLFTVAVHRPVKVTVAVAGVSLLSLPVYAVLRPELGEPPILLALLGVAITVAVVGWGLFVRHRRELVLSLRERAARAEVEARLRAEHAQHLAREEIAREMHDVLGHRLSLMSVYAGALEYRRDASPDEVAQAARVIRESAHQALQDLREIIGVLRAPVGELPQPGFADLSALVAESVRAGMRVRFQAETSGTVPDGLGRTVYRIVQEGLTNVRKHAPGAEVTVTVAGAPGKGLTVDVCNDAPPATLQPATAHPHAASVAEVRAGRDPVRGPDRTDGGLDGGLGGGSGGGLGAGSAFTLVGPGQGLVGLAERASLAGGRLTHRRTETGGFHLSAWLPWPP